jgi:hypothetical protein
MLETVAAESQALELYLADSRRKNCGIFPVFCQATEYLEKGFNCCR